MARKTTPTTSKKAAAKPKADKVAAEAKEPKAKAASDAATLKKPDLLDEVVKRTNLKKRDAKPAVEAAMAIIEEALRNGTELNLPPLGKLRMVKTKDLEGGATVMTLKLRTPKNASAGATSGVAETGDAN